MKARIAQVIAGAALIFLVGTSMAVVPLPGGSPVPGAVARDSTGEIIGAVVGFDGRRPVILLRNGSDRALLLLEEDFSFSSPVSRVFYDGANCTGNPVAIESFTNGGSKGFMEWQNRIYTMGAGNTLIRNSNTTEQTISVASRFISVNSTGQQCTDFGGNQNESNVFPAEIVDDLDNLFVPPFTLE